MIKPVVVADMDECIVSLLDSWLHEYTVVSYEPPRRRDEFTSYSFSGQFQDMDLWWSCIDNGNVLANARPRPGALASLQILNDATETYIVTYARSEAEGKAHTQKLRWLQKHAPWFDRDKVIFTKHKHLVNGDYMLEDSLDNLHAWVTAGENRSGILIDAPWNKAVTPVHCRRAYDLGHAVDMIFRLEGLDHVEM